MVVRRTVVNGNAFSRVRIPAAVVSALGELATDQQNRMLVAQAGGS